MAVNQLVPGLPPQAPAQVSRGLNLWLELRDPDELPRLMAGIAQAQKQTRAKLLQQGNVHFARFLPSRGVTVAYPDGSKKQLVVALQVITEYDGDLDAYATDFIFTIGDVFDTILRFVQGAPPLPVRDHPAEFVNFIRSSNAVIVGPDAVPDWSLFSAYPQRTVLELLGSARTTQIPVADPALQPVNFPDVQANILHGVNRPLSRHFCLRFGDGFKARAFIGRLCTGHANTPTVSSAHWQNPAPAWYLNLGLTYRGLVALGVDQADQQILKAHFTAFVEGPDHFRRARRNGDLFSSHPDTWVLGGTHHQVDLVLSLYAADPTMLDEKSQLLKTSWSECELELLFTQDAAALPDNQVHFGYRDGMSQPRLAIEGLYRSEQPSSASRQPAASAGSFLLGATYTNMYGGAGSLSGLSPALATNATFAALRLMRQDVQAFEALLDEGERLYKDAGVKRDWLAAKLMGRWQSGTPTSLSSDLALEEPDARDRNDFDFAPGAAGATDFDDADGARCPIGAHIRRMNPRSSRVAGMPHSRRLIRRGMPYGQAFDKDKPDSTERGLLGIFLCADLERQFEFLLHTWANADFFATGIGGTQDPLIGAQAATGLAPVSAEFRCLAPDGRTPVTLDMPRLVHTRGSLYLMMPGLAGLQHLAGAAIVDPIVAAATVPDAALQQRAAPFDPMRFDPRSRAFLRDPYATYTTIHEELSPPIAYIASMDSVWVFGHDLIREVCTQTDVYYKREDPLVGPAGILTLDQPAHGATREAIDPLFGRAIEHAAADATSIVAALMQSLDQGPVEWIRQFARPLSQRLFARVLALDESNIADLLLRVELALSAHNPKGSPASSADFARAIKGVGAWFLSAGDRTSDTTAQLAPLLRALYSLPLQDPTANLDKVKEFAANAGCLALAGFKPLEWLIGLVTYHLLKDERHLLDLLHTRQAAGKLDYKTVIDELVRYDTPLPMANRYTRSETTLGGMQLAKGARLTLVYAAANREPRFGGPDRIDFDRSPDLKAGMGFGHGARECLGYALAHQVLQPVIQALIDAPRRPRLATGYVPQFGGNPYFRFLHHLDLAW